MAAASLARKRVGIVADPLTFACLTHEVDAVAIVPGLSSREMREMRLDLLFVESAWHGLQGRWRDRIAQPSGGPWLGSFALRRLASTARKLGVPSVFWNKEDDVHFERFVRSASLFDHILTVDGNAVARYRDRLGHKRSVDVLPFPIQPRLHGFRRFEPSRPWPVFVGSYSSRIHKRRRAWQTMLFDAATRVGPLTIYDRNSDRTSQSYRFPDAANVEVRPAVEHSRTAELYHRHLPALNVNTIENSPTMVSRRLMEIMACGAFAVTTPARAVAERFDDLCVTVSSEREASDVFERLQRDGADATDLDRMREASRYVTEHYSWGSALERIFGLIERA